MSNSTNDNKGLNNERNRPQGVKNVIPNVKCPSCFCDLIIGTTSFTSVVDWVLTPEDVAKSKERLKNRILETDKLDPEVKDKIIGYIDSKDTLFGPDAVDVLFDNFVNDNK